MGRQSNFGARLHHLVAVMSHESDQLLLEQLGLGLAQYKILRVVNEHPHIQQRAIARELGQTEASISRQVKLLYEKSMLISHANPSNLREHLTDLTEKGLRTITAAETIISKYHDEITSGFNAKQLQQFDDLLAALHDAVCAPGQHAE